MFPRVTSRSSRTTIRTRAAVMAAGLGASVALGAGVAAATGTTAASTTTTAAASAVQAQAAAQAKAAKAESAAKTAATKKAATWVDPVKKYTLSASFAQNGGMWAHKHSGQDFAVPIGTNVVATHGGTVVKAGGNGAGDGPAYGNAIVIKHGNGTYSQYAHLSKINVKIGQVVKTGQSIAKSGNTGNSSGPHLHFEIRTTPNYGSAVDPVAFLKSKGVTV
ncbi:MULTISPECIES: M23 family metallopeptidase [Streptomyces]|uniref:M23 family metallopeptidase n=1 Tax=Streptomyces TaxID=1883 RepID=UPI0004BF8A92|nr:MULTISPECIES: M23 family metallopeptidase [unclassified Streptomyces]KOT93309.1 peptidase [Streptomyces sp. NRRL F-4711]KOX27739.1 peptidase [Streptomyces sp. NRRL F-4707]KOX42499.1 peptidase [Streptomyces sp. NRRL F-7442]NEB59881.1 M23 family metallopeptidase [Streptomyces diastaticus]